MSHHKAFFVNAFRQLRERKRPKQKTTRFMGGPDLMPSVRVQLHLFSVQVAKIRWYFPQKFFLRNFCFKPVFLQYLPDTSAFQSRKYLALVPCTHAFLERILEVLAKVTVVTTWMPFGPQQAKKSFVISFFATAVCRFMVRRTWVR